MAFQYRNLLAIMLPITFLLLSCGQSKAQSPHLIKIREALSMQAEDQELNKLIPLVRKNDIRTVEFLVYTLPRHLNPAVRGHIARILKHVGDAEATGEKPEKVINALVEALDDTTLYRDPTEPIECGKGVINSEWSVRAEAAESLGVLNASTKPAIEKLTQIARLKDPKRLRARLAAIVSLGQIGPAADGSAAVVAEVLTEKEEQHIRLRQAAVKTLGQLGPGAASELPLLIRMLDNKRERVLAIYAIGGMREGAKEVIPRFIKSVHDPAGGSNYAAALTQMGKAVHPFLLEEIRSGDSKRVDRSLTILWHMKKQAAFAVDEIKKHLSDVDKQVRQKAVATLLRMEELAAPAQSELEEVILQDEDESIRDLAMIGLLMISSRNRPALERLGQMASSNEKMNMVSWAGRYAGSDARGIIPAVEQALESAEDKYQKLKAAEALLFIDVNSKKGLATIRRALGQSDRDLLLRAVSVCNWLGKNAEPFLAELRGLQGLNPRDQGQVDKAIESIEGK